MTKPRKMTITITGQLIDCLKLLHRTGLYGRSPQCQQDLKRGPFSAR
jgi:hypothetical protein